MSYDLDFWRYKSGVTLDHQSVYELLCAGSSVDGLEDLPIEQMVGRICQAFSDWERIGDTIFDGGDRGGFQLFTTQQFLRVDCYGMDGEDMNTFIDIANEFHCPLYDPQVPQRYG